MIKGLARIRKPEISEMKRKSAGNCYPDIVWSSTLQSGTSYYRRRLQNGSFNESYDDFTFAFSVRCVLGLNFSRWRIFAKEDCCEALRFKLSNCRLMCNRPPCLELLRAHRFQQPVRKGCFTSRKIRCVRFQTFGANKIDNT